MSRRTRTTTTVAAVGVTGAIAIAAVVASTGGGGGYGKAGSSQPVATSSIRTAATTVGGKPSTVLTDSHGSPLYYYAPDTATQSNVTGGLAGLWPPVTASSIPTAHGLAGTLTTVHDSHGSQLAYNGHLLYTFVSDHAGVVTGQGVQNFFVVTPNLAPAHGSTSSSTGGSTGGNMGTNGY